MIAFERNTWITSERENHIDVCVIVENGLLLSILNVNLYILTSNATGKTVIEYIIY